MVSDGHINSCHIQAFYAVSEAFLILVSVPEQPLPAIRRSFIRVALIKVVCAGSRLWWRFWCEYRTILVCRRHLLKAFYDSFTYFWHPMQFQCLYTLIQAFFAEALVGYKPQTTNFELLWDVEMFCWLGDATLAHTPHRDTLAGCAPVGLTSPISWRESSCTATLDDGGSHHRPRGPVNQPPNEWG